MFHVPLSEVTYDQLIEFFRAFPEGVRVEYKREVTNVPKVVSSFANTVGGIWVIGVDTDKANRAVLPPVGLLRRPGIEEQIVQSAQSSIYPPLTPAVRMFDIPGSPDKVLVVVKVGESIEAPHAIENSTKVYVRIASTTQPYELADLDRIEYQLKRRREPERRREELIADIAGRSIYRDHRSKIRVIVAPMYPRGIMLPMDNLLERAEALRLLHASRHVEEFRLVHAGIMSTGATPEQRQWYFETNTSGIVFYEEPGQIMGELEDWSDKQRVPFVNLDYLVSPIGAVLNTTLARLKGNVVNVMIRYEIHNFNVSLSRRSEAICEILEHSRNSEDV